MANVSVCEVRQCRLFLGLIPDSQRGFVVRGRGFLLARWCPLSGAVSSFCSWRGSTGLVDPARAHCAQARDWEQGLRFGLNSCTCLGIASLQLSLTLLSLQPGAVALLDSSTLR